MTPYVTRRLAHDSEAFTQGLLVADGCLVESTGLVGRSSLRCCDLETGRVLRQIAVDGDYAEGIALAGSRLYQLSWQSGIARVYEWPSLAAAGEIRYDGEGWGLTASPLGLIMSDGSSRLRIRDERFNIVSELQVRSRTVPIDRLNDLAWARGRLYANVWGASHLLEIRPEDGRVSRIVDCAALVAEAARTADDAVLNGIAYDADTDRFYLTGKLWPVLFEVEIARPDSRT